MPTSSTDRYAVTAHEIRGGRQLADLTTWLDEWAAIDELNDLGEFTGTLLVTPECCAVLVPLEPWLTELRVTRGTGVAWEGVLTSSSLAMGLNPGSQVEVTGSTMLGWLNWRVVRDVIDSTDAPIDACLWALEVIRSAIEVNDPQLLNYLTVHSGAEAIERAATIGKLAWESNLRGILGKQIDIANHGRAITVRPAGSCFGDLGVWGGNLFDGQWVLQRESGKDQPFATVAWVRGADGLLMSVGSEVNGLLVETSIDDSAIVDQEQAYAAGASAVTLDGRAPLQFLSDNAVIACDSGIDPCDLMPGACVVIQVESCGQQHEQQMRVMSVRHAGNAAGEDETEVELAVLPNVDRRAFPDPGVTEPTQAVSLRPIILHDTRDWNGLFTPDPDGYIPNRGTARTPDDTYNWQVKIYQLGTYYSGVGSNIVIPGSFPAFDLPTPWDNLGGLPNSAPMSYAFAIGDLAAIPSDYVYTTLEIGPFAVQIYNHPVNGWDIFVYDPLGTGPYPMEIIYADPTPITDQMIFVEQDFTGDTPYVGVWLGETLVAQTSTSGFYALDDLYPTVSTFIFQYDGLDLAGTPGDPWAVVGAAMFRGKLTPGQREAWRAYFFD